jgi:hypothetical protein
MGFLLGIRRAAGRRRCPQQAARTEMTSASSPPGVDPVERRVLAEDRVDQGSQASCACPLPPLPPLSLVCMCRCTARAVERDGEGAGGGIGGAGAGGALDVGGWGREGTGGDVRHRTSSSPQGWQRYEFHGLRSGAEHAGCALGFRRAGMVAKEPAEA